MRNEFPPEVKEIFYRSRYCLKCGRVDRPIEIHHIVGRDSNSALNACRLCDTCHEHIKHTNKYECMLFNITTKYLVSQGYHLIDKDYKFLEKFNYLLAEP